MINNNTNEKYNYGLAILRLIMCFEVVVCHFLSENKTILNLPFLSLRSLAVPIFIFMSFFLNSNIFIHSNKTKFKSRIKKLIRIQVFCSLVYFITYLTIQLIFNIKIIDNYNILFLQILTGHTILNKAMWFQVDLIILTIFFYYLFTINNKKIINNLLIIITTASLILQYSGLNYVFFSRLNNEFSVPLGRLIEIIPYSVLGIKLNNKKTIEYINNKKYIIVFMFILSFLIKLIPTPAGFNYQGLFLIMLTISIFLFFYTIPCKSLKSFEKNTIKYISKNTLEIYCYHNLIGFFVVQ